MKPDQRKKIAQGFAKMIEEILEGADGIRPSQILGLGKNANGHMTTEMKCKIRELIEIATPEMSIEEERERQERRDQYDYIASGEAFR